MGMGGRTNNKSWCNGGKAFIMRGHWGLWGYTWGVREMAMGLQAPGHCGGVSQGLVGTFCNLWTLIVGRGAGVEEAELQPYPSHMDRVGSLKGSPYLGLILVGYMWLPLLAIPLLYF